MPALTRVQRRATCFHEAGHAVIFALGGVNVFGAAVAPTGALAWRVASNDGRTCSGLWGLCRKAELVLPRQLLRWLMSEGGLHPDGRGHEAILASPEGQTLLLGLPEEQRREIRAQIVGLLAGPAAEQLSRGALPRLCGRSDLDDVSRAVALCSLLPGKPQLEPAVRLVVEVLKRPVVWGLVAALAGELERNGEIDRRIMTFLPAAEAGWPAEWVAA